MPADLLERVAATAHYVIARTDPSMLGVTKLNKILWYSDLEHYRRRGKSITGLRHYTRMPQGPMSKDIGRAVQVLKNNRAIVERSTKVVDYTRRELLWLKQPDLSGFTAEQIDLMNQMIAWISPLSADEVSRITHGDPLWKELIDNENMAIGPASIVAGPPSPKQLEWALKQVRH
jgi:hypothetical protein